MGSVSGINRPVRFTAPDGWQVRVMSYRSPGDSAQVMRYFTVRRWGVVKLATTDVAAVARLMGDALGELSEVAR